MSLEEQLLDFMLYASDFSSLLSFLEDKNVLTLSSEEEVVKSVVDAVKASLKEKPHSITLKKRRGNCHDVSILRDSLNKALIHCTNKSTLSTIFHSESYNKRTERADKHVIDTCRYFNDVGISNAFHFGDSFAGSTLGKGLPSKLIDTLYNFLSCPDFSLCLSDNCVIDTFHDLFEVALCKKESPIQVFVLYTEWLCQVLMVMTSDILFHHSCNVNISTSTSTPLILNSGRKKILSRLSNKFLEIAPILYSLKNGGMDEARIFPQIGKNLFKFYLALLLSNMEREDYSDVLHSSVSLSLLSDEEFYFLQFCLLHHFIFGCLPLNKAVFPDAPEPSSFSVIDFSCALAKKRLRENGKQGMVEMFSRIFCNVSLRSGCRCLCIDGNSFPSQLDLHHFLNICALCNHKQFLSLFANFFAFKLQVFE